MSVPVSLPQEIQTKIDSARIVIFHSKLTDIRSLKQWLTDHGLDFRLVEMPMADQAQRQQFQELSQVFHWQQLPLIFLEGRFVGGEIELRQALGGHEDDVNRWMAGLGYGGLLPVVLGLVALLAGPQTWRPGIESLMLGYGAVILSFVGAIHWGLVIGGGARGNLGRRHLLWGVVPALWAWPTLALPFSLGAVLQALGLLTAWRIDMAWYPDSHALRHFRKLRSHLTGGLVICLLIAAGLGLG